MRDGEWPRQPWRRRRPSHDGRRAELERTLHLEIVTPERLAYSDDVDMVLVPGIDGELGILPHHTPLVSLLGVGELRIRKGGAEESFAIVGGFLQVRPDKVVVMAETADMASEIDLEKAQEARREAERAARVRLPRGRRPGHRPGGAPGGAAPHPGRRAPAPGGPAARLAMADARPFHWEYRPGADAPEAFRIEGGRPLRGTVQVSGAKNAALKLLAAAVLTGERCRFTNVPEIEDVRVMVGVLRDLGVVVDHPAPGVYEVAAGDVDWLFVPLEAAAKMRASFILLGPLLSRFGRVIISNPGGDRIGRRPVNLHVDAMRALGAEIEYRNGYYFAQAPGRLRGGEVTFPQVTVMGTENAMLAATLAEGHTVIRPAAQEPEIDDLIAFLVKMGADVARTSPDTIEVHGRKRLRGANHVVVPDRIETGTFLVAAAVTGGKMTLENAACDHVGALVEAFGRVGVPVACGTHTIEIDATGLRPGDLRACDIETAPYPGLATDLQPPTCVLLTQASGTSQGPRGDLRGPHRVAGGAAQAGRPGGHRGRAPRVDPRPVPAPRRRGRDRRPAGRRVAHPRRARRGRDVRHPRRAPRPARL